MLEFLNNCSPNGDTNSAQQISKDNSYRIGLKKLDDLCKDKEWFAELEIDEFLRFVVYVHKMNEEILRFVPDFVEGIPVLIHFIGSKTVKRENFTTIEHEPFILTKSISVEELPSEDIIDVDDLEQKLDQLEKMCSLNILEDIFFEIHDGKNALTNLSSKYPDVKTQLQKLYDEYGFDIVYDSLGI